MDGTYALLSAAKNGDKSACEEIVVENSGLIWSVVRRFMGRGTDAEDLYQLGCMGLLKAISGFDESLGNKFSTYAVPKIAGEIRRFLRDDGTVKVSRHLKENSHKIRCAREKLSQRLNREPTLSEIAEITGISPEEIAESDCAHISVDSLDRVTNDDGQTLEATIGNCGFEELVLDKLCLSQAIESLSPRDKSVIYLRFYKGFTQSKTAQILNTSQVQVSRIERNAIKKLKTII